MKKVKTNTVKQSKKRINWKHLGMSFMLAFLSFILSFFIGAVFQYISPNNIESATIHYVWYLFLAVIMANFALKYDSHKYARTPSALAIIIGMLIFGYSGGLGSIGGFLIVWIVSYDLMQIKTGLKQLKNKANKYEFEQAKQEILNEKVSDKKHTYNSVGYVLGVFFVIFVVVGFFYTYSTEEIFACNKTTMKKTQDIINKALPNLNDSLRLIEQELVEQSDNYLKCKARSNYDELPVVYYTVKKQPNGEMLIQTNPLEDAFKNNLINMFGSVNADSSSPQSNRLKLLSELLLYQLSHNKQVAKVKDILTPDLSEIDDVISDNCSVLTPLLWHSFDSDMVLINRFIHQGVLGYQININGKTIMYQFGEKWNFDTDEFVGYNVSVNIEDKFSSKELNDKQAIEYIDQNICIPLNAQLNKMKNLSVENIAKKLSR